MKKISIIIVTYNSTKDIRDCINSIYANNDIGDELEIIVVDNNSKDIVILKQILSDVFPQVILIENIKNGGYGQGNNLGIHNSSAPIIMIMNPDVRLFEPIFAHVIKHFKTTQRLLLLGIQQYNSKVLKGAPFLPKIPSITNLLLYKVCAEFKIYIPKLFFISGACFFLKKIDFCKIGAFDENIFLYGEETDINERILRNKSKIKFDGSIGYIHPMHNRGDNVITMKREIESMLYLCNKYGWSKTKRIKTYIRYYRLLLKRATRHNDNKQRESYEEIIEYLGASINEFK